MTAAALKSICKELKQYNTPELNDKMYLHYKGWQDIEPCLGAYFNCKALWLEGNGLDRLQNLEKLTQLKCLFVHENLLEEVSGLEANTELDTLNISNNCISRLSGISHLRVLTTLQATNNRFQTAEDLAHLRECESLISVDFSNCRIEDPAVIDILASMPNLKCVYLTGNPVVRKIRNYRKTIVGRCLNLTYLDDRPVFDDERRCVSAWTAAGGLEGTKESDARARQAEKAERQRITEEKEERERRNREAFRDMMEQARTRRREQEASDAETGPSGGETTGGETTGGETTDGDTDCATAGETTDGDTTDAGSSVADGNDVGGPLAEDGQSDTETSEVPDLEDSSLDDDSAAESIKSVDVEEQDSMTEVKEPATMATVDAEAASSSLAVDLDELD